MITRMKLMSAVIQVNQPISSLLDFMLIVTILFGVPKIVQGSWNISRGLSQEGITSVIAGFMTCMAVPIIRMFAGWLGVTI